MKIGNWFEIGEDCIVTTVVALGVMIVFSLIIVGVTYYNVTAVLHGCG
jgi:hypothetical protein